MTDIRLCGIITSIALLTGCAGPGREETLNDLIGQDLDIAIETLGQPQDVVELGQGRRTYVWQRTFTFEYGPPSFTLEEWRYDSTYWFEDELRDAPARRCSTSLTVGFDLLVESWDYQCETITVDRERWPTRHDHRNPANFPR